MDLFQNTNSQQENHHTVLRASQDAKRAIMHTSDSTKFVIFTLENRDNITQIDSGKYESVQIDDNIVDCAFFPSAFGVVIAIGYEKNGLKFIKEKPDGSYANIDYKIGGPENDNGHSFTLEVPKFQKNLRVSFLPPELNIGYISNDIICIFFVDFQTSLISLIPIRRYNASNTVWFNFTANYSIWRCTFDKGFIFEKYNLNSFKEDVRISTLTEKKDLQKQDFVDASISPIKYNGKDRIAFVMQNGQIYFINNENTVKYTDSNIKNPMSIEWSPFGARIAIFSNDEAPTIFVETSCDSWEVMNDLF